MKKIISVLFSWTIMLGAPALFTACNDDDENTKTESVTDNKTPDNPTQDNFAPLTPAEAAKKCAKSGDVARSGNNQLYVNIHNQLFSYQYENGRLVSMCQYTDCKSSEDALAMYDDAVKKSQKGVAPSVSGTFFILTITDTDEYEDYIGMTIDQLADALKKEGLA